MIKKVLRCLMGKPLLILFAATRLPSLIPWIRRFENFQISADQALLVCRAVWRRDSCRLLVFGVGNDSRFWMAANTRGTTLFVENDRGWIERVSQRNPDLRIIPVEYSTRCREWRADLATGRDLSLLLPEMARESPWDVILVDAPAGDTPDGPGRLQSIFNAGRLVRPGGWVFVHDAGRELEQFAPGILYGREKRAVREGNMDGYLF